MQAAFVKSSSYNLSCYFLKLPGKSLEPFKYRSYVDNKT